MAKKKKKSGPAKLEILLHQPGIDALLRAGLGGLATVLKQMEGEPKSDKLPGGPWSKGAKHPWEVTESRIILDFGKPEDAAEYLKRLFAYAFRIDKENAIDLPATYDGVQQRMVRARLQQGLMLTFLQHGKSRKGEKKDVERSDEIDGTQLIYSHRPISWYKHQDGHKDLTDGKTGELVQKPVELPGTLYPGAAVRHNGFSGHTKHEGSVAELLCAYFAIIGTLSLPINRGSAVLLIPHVADLVDFAQRRAFVSPRSYPDCLIEGVGDAVLGVYTRLKGSASARRLKVPAVSAFLFRPTAWASQQKSRVASIRIEPLEPAAERIFDVAQEYFKPRLKTKIVRETSGRGKNKTETEVEQSFWATSIVKPLIADNLAEGRLWFANFATLFTRNDPVNHKPLRNRLKYEKEGLFQMVKAELWKDEGQRALVLGVQYALKCQYGKIYSELESNPSGMKKRFEKEFEKWRIQFASAKTADQFRNAACDLMSRARGNDEIQKHWQEVIPLINENSWRLGRDLALLALASYKGDKKDSGNGDTEVDSADG